MNNIMLTMYNSYREEAQRLFLKIRTEMSYSVDLDQATMMVLAILMLRQWINVSVY
jgi:hypothetical protein